MATWPDLTTYAAYARIPDTLDDDAIEAALAAVHAAIVARCPTLAEVDDIPDDVAQAALLWCNRLVARRNSPEGVVGVGEMGVANIGRYDADVGRLLGPYTAVTLA